MVLGCHDRQPLSSLAFGREWKLQLPPFYVSDSAARGVAAPYSGSVGVVIVASSIAVTVAASRHAVSNDVLPTSDISAASRGNLTTEIASVRIVAGDKPA